jgi:hypothetical protein|tara:strand:- start:1026 stop:2255 length:1230 start_codon:yes stop_codon:yes gene_type:complete
MKMFNVLYGLNKVKFSLLLFFFFFLFQAVFYFVQLSVFEKTLVGPRQFKYILGFLLIFVCMYFTFKFLLGVSVSKVGLKALFVYYIYIFQSLFVILLFNNSIDPFLYNYSLTLFLYFIIIFMYTVNGGIFLNMSRSVPIYPIFFLITLIALFEFFRQENVFFSVKPFLSDIPSIKFDHINGYIRLNSIFKSPIDYSLINAIFSGFFLALFSIDKNKKWLMVWFLMSLCQFLILVRSGIVCWFFVNLICCWCYFPKKRLFFLSLSLFFVPVLFLINIFISILDPTNLFHRLNNWLDLINRLNSSDYLVNLFGMGIVQNGSFGERNSIVIDNLYIGVLLCSGYIGLFLFLSSMFYLYKVLYIEGDKLAMWKRATIVGFLLAGLFENSMHNLYIMMLPAFFYIYNKSFRKTL